MTHLHICSLWEKRERKKDDIGVNLIGALNFFPNIICKKIHPVEIEKKNRSAFTRTGSWRISKRLLICTMRLMFWKNLKPTLGEDLRLVSSLGVDGGAAQLHESGTLHLGAEEHDERTRIRGLLGNRDRKLLRELFKQRLALPGPSPGEEHGVRP